MKFAFATLSVACLAGFGVALAAPAAPSEAAAAEAKALIQSGCVSCHEEAVIVGLRRSEAQWDEVLNRMVGMGAAVSPADMAKIRAYLVANYSETPAAPAK
jgi:mono/diheme cytochrome c family protein